MKKITILLALTVLITNIAFGLEDGMSFTVLPSGQKVVIKEVHDNNIVKIDTWINTGSINEDDKTTGISHFLEHLFFKGTEKHPTGEFDKLLDSKGAVVNAATSKDFTHYYIEIPSAYFDLALELHSDMLLNPMIPRKELERERPVVIEEISKTKDSPQNRLFDNLYKIIYEKSKHPYQRNVIGNKEIIENVTREEILNYFNRFYTPDAYTTVIVGDVNKDEALKKVAKAFSNSKKRKQEKVKYPKIKPIEKIETIETTMDINKAYIMLAFLAPKFSSDRDNYALDVLATMLGSGKSSALNQKIKEEQQLVLSIYSGNYSQKDSGIFYIGATLNPKNKIKTIEEILKEIQKIQQGDFEISQLQRAKNIIKTDTYYSRESISNISDDLGYDFTFNKDENYYENYLKNIDKVSKKDIIRVAKKYLITDKYALSVVNPSNYKEISNIEAKKDNILEQKLVEQKDNKKKFVLNNGVTLTTEKKKTNSIIAIDISILGSKAIEKKPTSALLASNSVLTGTQNYTNSQLAQYLDENGIKLSVNSTNDIFSFSLQTTKDNLDKSIEILDEVLNRPTFSDFEINKIKQRKIQELKSVSDSPTSFVFDEFKKQAYQGTIYGQNSAFLLNNIDKVTRNDIVEYYSRVINPKNMHIAIVGDIDEDYLANKFNEIIKDNNQPKFDYSKYNYVPFRPTQNVQATLYKDELQAHWIALGYKICSINNRKDIAVLNVINAILGEGMSSRLFVNLRENKGLAYTVGSTINSNILDGTFISYIGTNAKSVEEAKKGILTEFEILKKEMVTTQELNDAKDKIMGKFLLSLETNMDEADILGWYSVLGRNLGALEEYKKMINEVTQADIINVANKYFSKPYIYTVVKQK